MTDYQWIHIFILCGCTFWAYRAQGIQAYILRPYTYVQLTLDFIIWRVGLYDASVGFSDDMLIILCGCISQAYRGSCGV